MALQVWLPLNGNIENHGLLGDLITSSSPSFSTGGKIGNQCMSGGSLSMSADQTQQVLNNSEFSFATWIYINSDTGSGSTAIFGNEGMTPPNNRRFTIFLYDTLQKIHLSWQNYDSSGTVIGTITGAVIPLKKWTHIAVTYSKKLKLTTIYLNGIVHAEYNTGDFTSPSYSYETRLMPNNSSIRYNDYRVYSHCLSAKEVKEISKGLVLHYPMSDGHVEPTTNILNEVNPSYCYNGSNGQYGFNDETDFHYIDGVFHGKYCRKVYEGTIRSVNDFYPFFDNLHPASNGAFKTLSFDLYPTQGSSITF